MRYNQIPILRNLKGKRFHRRVLYPEIPKSDTDIIITSKYGDRYDTLAFRYYNDVELWWIIAKANGEFNGDFIFVPNTKIRIPQNIESIIAEFKRLNGDG